LVGLARGGRWLGRLARGDRLVDDARDLRIALGGREALVVAGRLVAVAELRVDLAERVEQLGLGIDRIRGLELDARLVVAALLVRLGGLRDVRLGVLGLAGERRRGGEDQDAERREPA